jgi:FAD dependent oxidoreductase TIGR03364
MICNGADFETLYPSHMRDMPLTRCKLQMMRFASQQGWDIGPALCGGLSLIHYKSFGAAPSLQLLKQRIENEMPEYVQYGIHVMVSQNGRGELTVGDSHEYGLTHDPFDRQQINDLILKYLATFARFKEPSITETWNGTYSKLTNNEPYLFISPEQGVYIFNGLGGNGMTLSFGLAEQLVQKHFQ